MERSLGLVVPAYRPSVGELIEYVERLQATLSPAVIRIELDAPRESTLEQLEACPVAVHVSDRRRGKGAAITDGFEALDTEILAFADADGSTPAESLAKVIERLERSGAALSIGSRRHPDAQIVSHQTFVRRRLGDAFAATARHALGVDLYDFQCGAKALTAETWERIRHQLFEPGFAWDVELIAVVAALGLPIEEVPITWEDQPGSTVSTVSTSIALARTVLVARHRMKLRANGPLHTALDRFLGGRPALIERSGAGR